MLVDDRTLDMNAKSIDEESTTKSDEDLRNDKDRVGDVKYWRQWVNLVDDVKYKD